MSSEAAVLGTPAVYIAKTGRGYTDDQEARYGLVRNVQPTEFAAALEAIDSYLAADAAETAAAHARLLAERIDVTDWMVDWFESCEW
jgi:predicted glycosyltransferase